jgi:hypothetical protein
MSQYIKTISIEYGVLRPFSSDDINSGMGGEYSYIVKEYTDKRSEAASGFQVEITKVEDLHAADLSKGDGREYFRYLHAFYTYGGIAAITKVWLSRTKDTTEGDGRTEDINRNRGSFLYLCWEYEKENTHSYSIPLGILFPASYLLFHLLTNKVVTAAHPFYTVDCRNTVTEGTEVTVPLGDVVFSQDSVGKLIGGAWEDETVYETVQEMLRMSLEDRRAYIAARFDQLRVVPIRRHADTAGDATNRLMVSLDNRRLLIMRATLPADERITVRVATDRQRKFELDRKWTAKDEGFTIKIRPKGDSIDPFKSDL